MTTSTVLCTICGEPMPPELAEYGEHRHGHCMAGVTADEILPDPPACCSWYPDNFWGAWRDVPEQCPKCGRALTR